MPLTHDELVDLRNDANAVLAILSTMPKTGFKAYDAATIKLALNCFLAIYPKSLLKHVMESNHGK